MGLRTKTILVVGLTFLVLMVVMGAGTRIFLMRGALALESIQAQRGAERVLRLIDSDLAGLKATTADWAVWDDTYRFAAERNPDYIESNLQASSLNTLKVDFMCFRGRGARHIFEVFVDPDTGMVAPMPEALSIALEDMVDGLNFDESHKNGKSGILMRGQTPFLIGAMPILPSDANAPARGVMIMGRRLDPAAVERFSALTGASVTVQALAEPFKAEDFDAAKELLVLKTAIVTRVQGPDTIAGFALQSDVNGRYVLMVKASQPRLLFQAVTAAFRYYSVFLVAVALAVIGIAILLVDQAVLKPLNRLSDAVVRAKGATRLNSSPHLLSRKDEIGALGSAVNAFLEEIGQQNRALEDANRLLEADITRRQQIEAELAQERDHLKAALAQVKTLSGLLPICSICKQIRNDSGYWEKIETYIQHHSDAAFSHGICPECAKRHYPDFDLYEET